MISVLDRENRCISEQLEDEGVFDQFYLPFLHHFENELNKIAEEMGCSMSDTIKKDLLLYVKENLIEYSVRTLIADLNEQKEEYKFYCDSLLERVEVIYQKYPLLQDELTLKIDRTVVAVKEIYVRLIESRKIIEKEFGINIDMLAGIQLGQGDTHNHGRTVAILTFKDGKYLVYKPRSMKPERCFCALCDWVNQFKGRFELKNPKVLDMGSYGWQEFVDRVECYEESEVRAYYYRVGEAMALFYILNTSDLHAENILPCGEYPIFIDLETLLTATKREKKNGGITESLNNVFQHSVFMTSILPQVLGQGIIDIDISGLGARAGQQSQKMKYLALVDKGTSNIHFEEKLLVTREMNNGVRFKGEQVDYTNYVEELEQGFAYVYNLMLNNKEVLFSFFEELFEAGEYRQVLRGTYVYEKFLTSSVHPKYYTSRDRRLNLFGLINSQKTIRGEYEILQLMEHDVPYFYAKYKSTGLFTIDGEVEKEYFVESLCEMVQNNVVMLSKVDLSRQLAFIRNAVMLAKEDIMHANGRYRENINQKDFEQSALSAIVAKIHDYAVWNQSGTACTFVDLRMNGEHSTIGNMDPTLYNGVGMIFFLFAYADYTRKKKDMEFARAALRGFEEMFPVEKAVCSTSVFSGYYSYVYLYYNLYKFTNDNIFYKKYEACIQNIKEYDCTEEEIFDVIAGISGSIILLVNIYEQEQDPNLMPLIEKYTDSLVSKLSRPEQCLTGFSHGLAGYELALMKAWQVTGNQDYKILAEKLEKEEDVFYSFTENNWLDRRKEGLECAMFWCHGAPGILLGRSYFTKSDSFKEKYQLQLDMICRSIEETRMNDSLCHGTMGNLDILFTIARNIGERELEQKTKELALHLEKKLIVEGVEYGIPQMKGLISFMLGLSGIGYGLLRNKRRELPCVLGLEVLKRDGNVRNYDNE